MHKTRADQLSLNLVYKIVSDRRSALKKRRGSEWSNNSREVKEEEKESRKLGLGRQGPQGFTSGHNNLNNYSGFTKETPEV